MKTGRQSPTVDPSRSGDEDYRLVDENGAGVVGRNVPQYPNTLSSVLLDVFISPHETTSRDR